jgi:uncharacterized Zn finger protein
MAWRDYYGYGYFPRFPRSVPRAAKGGIKAQSKKAGFGQSWWAKRWIAVLESFNIGARLGRGRSYARSGQVLSIDIKEGNVNAKVQGSRPQPYEIVIKVKTLSGSDGRKLGKALSSQAIFAAKLLAGEMPQDIEKVFADAGLSLFPEKLGDLDTDCSCPDWSNPCKHIAAVYYLLGEEFDRDPFLIFKLRGLDRKELIEMLGSAPSGPAQVAQKKGAPDELAAPQPASTEPLNPEAKSYWAGMELPAGWLGEVRPPPIPAALPKRLGNFPFWRGNERFLEAMEPVYAQAALGVQAVLIGERQFETIS